MESFTPLLEELNRTEKEYEIKSERYKELRSIVLQDAYGKSELKSASVNDDAPSLKKTVKNRIREYHSLKSNAEKFRGNDREKIKFMETLQQNNKGILTSLHVDSIQKLIDKIQQ